VQRSRPILGGDPPKADGSPGKGRSALLSWLLPAAVSAGILVLLYRGVSWNSTSAAVSSVDIPWAVAFVVLSAVEPVPRGLRWNDLTGAADRKGSIRALYIAKATNNLLPLRAGDAIRAQYARDRLAVPYSRSAASLVAELAIDLFVLCLLGLCFAALSLEGRVPVLAVCAAGAAGIVSGVLVLGRWAGRPEGSGRGRVGSFLAGTARHVSAMFSGRSGRAALRWTPVIWAHAFVTSYCGLRMCLPSVSPEGALASILFVYLSVIVPSAPGFVGTYHAAVAGSMAVMGYRLVDNPLAPLLIHVLQLIPQTVIGLTAGLSYLVANDWRASLAKFKMVRPDLREDVR